MFTDKEHRGPFEFSDELGNLSIGAESVGIVVPAQGVEANDKDLLLSTTEKEDSGASSHNGADYSAPLFDASSGPLVAIDTQPTVQAAQPSMAIDDLLGLGFTAPAPAPEPAPAPAPPALILNAKAVLDPGTFQQKWRQLPISISQVCETLMTYCFIFYFFLYMKVLELIYSWFRGNELLKVN